MKRREFISSAALLPGAMMQTSQGITHVDTKRDGAAVSSSIVRAQTVSPEGAAPGAKAFVQFNGPTRQLAALASGFVTLEPGAQPHPPHQHPEEEIMIVGEGSGEFFINGQAQHVTVGDSLFAEANVLHGVRNTGTSRMTFYFIKMQGKTA
jgi:quercetin dioxygenase-like cupin family protein